MTEINTNNGIDLYNQYFKKMDAMEKEDGYVTNQELYLFSSKPLLDNKKASIESIMKEQEFFKKYAGDNNKLTIEEFEKMCNDPVYQKEVAPHLGRGELNTTENTDCLCKPDIITESDPMPEPSTSIMDC